MSRKFEGFTAAVAQVSVDGDERGALALLQGVSVYNSEPGGRAHWQLDATGLVGVKADIQRILSLVSDACRPVQLLLQLPMESSPRVLPLFVATQYSGGVTCGNLLVTSAASGPAAFSGVFSPPAAPPKAANERTTSQAYAAFGIELRDQDSDEPNRPVFTGVASYRRDTDVQINLAGYGTKCMNPGYGPVVALEAGGKNGTPRIIIWGDIRMEDPTHIISLDGAREVHRVD